MPSKHLRFPFTLLLFLAAWSFVPLFGAQAQDTPTVLPLVETFDAVVEGLPPGWVNDSSGELRVTLAGERRAKEGQGAWRISVPVWYAGAAQVKRGGIPVEEGEAYAVEVWLRGEDLDVPVTFGLRSQGGAGTVYLARECAVGPEWRRFALQGQAPVSD